MLVWGLPKTWPQFSTLQKEMKLFFGSKKKERKKRHKKQREKYIQLPPPPSDLFISHTAWEFVVQLSKSIELLYLSSSFTQLFLSFVSHKFPRFILHTSTIFWRTYLKCISNILWWKNKWSADDQTRSGLNFPTESLRRLKDTNNRVLSPNRALSIKTD